MLRKIITFAFILLAQNTAFCSVRSYVATGAAGAGIAALSTKFILKQNSKPGVIACAATAGLLFGLTARWLHVRHKKRTIKAEHKLGLESGLVPVKEQETYTNTEKELAEQFQARRKYTTFTQYVFQRIYDGGDHSLHPFSGTLPIVVKEQNKDAKLLHVPVYFFPGKSWVDALLNPLDLHNALVTAGIRNISFERDYYGKFFLRGVTYKQSTLSSDIDEAYKGCITWGLRIGRSNGKGFSEAHEDDIENHMCKIVPGETATKWVAQSEIHSKEGSFISDDIQALWVRTHDTTLKKWPFWWIINLYCFKNPNCYETPTYELPVFWIEAQGDQIPV